MDFVMVKIAVAKIISLACQRDEWQDLGENSS